MVIFLYGEDDFSSRRKLNEIIAQYRTKNPHGFNFYRIDVQEKDALGELREKVAGVSMFPEKKLIVLENAFSLRASAGGKADTKSANPREEELLSFLKQNAFQQDADTFLAFWQKGEPLKTSPLFKELTKKPNLVYHLEKLEGRNLEAWVARETADRGGAISSSAVRFLAAAVGSDLWRMEQELLKLVNYARGSIVELSDAQKMVRSKIDSSIFKTIDAIADRDKKTALALIMRELEAGTNELYLMAMIAYQLRNLIMVGASGDGKKLKIHPYVLKKTLGQLKRFSFADLKRAHQLLFSFDVASKSGRIQPDLALEMLALEI